MTPYFALLSMWIAGAVQFSSRPRATIARLMYAAALIVTILMVGLRYRVGGDWIPYRDMYDTISLQPLTVALRLTDPGYGFLNWLSAKVDGDVYIPNLACSIVFMLGLSALVRRQAQPWLAMTVAIPYLVVVVGMGYTRQAAAIGLICWALADVDRSNIWQITAKVVLATLFHKTAILFLPILLAPVAKRNLLTGIVGSLLFALCAVFALGGSSNSLIASYVTGDYQSNGAAVRVLMNVIAAALFLTLRKSFSISPLERLVWTIISILAVISLAALATTASSVGVDRLSLFLIPLQVFVYANLPLLPQFSTKTRYVATLAVTFYSMSVMFVYLVYGSFSYTWLPYRTILIADRSLDI